MTLNELEWKHYETVKAYNAIKGWTCAVLVSLAFWLILGLGVVGVAKAEIIDSEPVETQINGIVDNIQIAYDKLKSEGFDVKIVPPMKSEPLTQEQKDAIKALQE